MSLFSKNNAEPNLGPLNAGKSEQNIANKSVQLQNLPRFATEGRGYKKSEVDAFLRELPTVSAHDIEIKVFNLQFHGYKKSEVDAYLDNYLASKEKQEVIKENYSLTPTSLYSATIPPLETYHKMAIKKKKHHRLLNVLLGIVGFVIFFWVIIFFTQATKSFPQIFIIVPFAGLTLLGFDISRGNFLKRVTTNVKQSFNKSIHGRSILYSIFVLLLSGLGSLFLLVVFLHFSLIGIGGFRTQTFDNTQLINKWVTTSSRGISTYNLSFKTSNGRKIETTVSATDYFGQKDIWDSVHKGKSYNIRIRGFDTILSDYSLISANQKGGPLEK